MNYLHYGYLLLLPVVLTACGGSGDSTKPLEIEEYVKIVASNSTVSESEQVVLTIDTNKSESYSVEWKHESGPKNYAFQKEDGSLTVIAPNVDGDTSIGYSAKVTFDSNQSATSNILIDVDNVEFPTLENAPKPNVFSNPNYTKHEGKKFDSAGIPLTTRSDGDHYYAVAIAAYGYDLYHAYQYYDEGKEELLEKFLNVAVWLRDNCIYTDYGFCSYRNDFEIDVYKLTHGWTTAMGQGQALSVLTAAHYLTGDESFAKVAFDALAAFQYPISEKGLTADFDGHLWYEEYGSEEMPVHVLNGFLFALSGIYDMSRNYDFELPKHVLDVGVASLVNNIHNYDWNFTSRYSYGPLFQLASTLSGPDAYHELHIFQLAWLYGITGEERIKEYAEKFLAQDMAGVKTINSIYKISQKIELIEASSTIDSVNFGSNNLMDGYWSIRNYWSSYRFPVDLNVTLNADVTIAGKLDKVVITSITENDFPTSFSLIEVNENNQETVLVESVTLENTVNTVYEHEVGGYKSYTVTFDVDIPVTTNNIIVRIAGTNDRIVRLREIDFQYARDNVMQEIIDFYKDR